MSNSSSVEKIVSWAAISYAFGFVVVILHTARLGLPVIVLIEPIYVWIGFPLAITAFFSNRLVNWVRRQAADARRELAIALKNDPEIRGLRPSDILESVIDGIGGPIALAFPYSQSMRLARFIIRKVFPEAPGDLESTEIPTRSVRLLMIPLHLSFAFQRFLNLAMLPMVILLGIWAYVWEIYPRVPKEYGGGSPRPVQLIIEAGTPLPEIVGGGITALWPGQPDSTNLVLTDTVTLMYSTTEAYYVRTKTGTSISISSDRIVGVVWPVVQPQRPRAPAGSDTTKNLNASPSPGAEPGPQSP